MPSVLVFADADDVGVSRLTSALASRLGVTWWRFGLSEDSVSVHVDEDGFRIEQPHALVRSIDLENSSLVIYRRRLLKLRPVVTSSLSSSADRAFSEREWASLIDGLLLAGEGRTCASWLNSPSATLLTGNKFSLLLHAARAGLPVPRFSVSSPVCFPPSNSGEIITKAISADEQIDALRYFSTALLSPEDTRDLQGARVSTPSLLQEYIAPRNELRVFYILGRFLSLALTPSSEHVDIRYVEPSKLRPRPHELSSELCAALESLAQALALSYCTFDLLVRSDGSPMLIDITPNGDWDHFETDTSPVVTEFLANAIVDHCMTASQGRS